MSEPSGTPPWRMNSPPGINTTRLVTHRPPIAVSPCLLALSVSYFRRTLWACDQMWSYIGMGSLGMCWHPDGNGMGDAAKISRRITATCVQNAILSLLIIHIIPGRQIDVAMDDPLLIPSVSSLTTSSYLWNYVRAANDVSHIEHLPSGGCRCVSHVYILRDRIQVTKVFRYRGERQGQRVLNESSIRIWELHFESSLQLPWETPIQHAITPPLVWLYPHQVVPSIPSVPALDFCASTHLSYAFNL